MNTPHPLQSATPPTPQAGPTSPVGSPAPPPPPRSWRRAADLPRPLLALEYLLFYFAGPLAYFFLVSEPGLLFPALWAFCFYTLAILLLDPSFDRRTLWKFRAMRDDLLRLLATFAILGTLLTIAVAIYDSRVGGPSILFSMPRERPTLWLIIMIFYPLVSVYPQEVIWRTFVFHRYARLFPARLPMIAASAIAFGHAHIVFHNWLAVALCIVGGFLFARTFDRSRSTLAAWIDHALYGCLVFTIGIGRFFYSGAVHT